MRYDGLVLQLLPGKRERHVLKEANCSVAVRLGPFYAAWLWEGEVRGAGGVRYFLPS